MYVIIIVTETRLLRLVLVLSDVVSYLFLLILMQVNFLFSLGRYMAVEEYAHLTVNIDLGSAIEMIRRCCETIRTTDFGVRKEAPGMDIAILMRSQHGCLLYTSPSPRD